MIRPLDKRYEAPEPPLQLGKVIKFQQRLFADISSALGALATYLGDRLGFFAALAEVGHITASDLARRQKLCPEMTSEWLRVMTCAGYVEYEPDGGTYFLPPEHAVLLANDNGPMSIAGGVQQLGGFSGQLPALLEAFRNGGGLPQSTYGRDLWDGMERLSATWFENELVDQWIAALPEVEAKLRTGGAVADVGCGSGRALVALAKSFPASRFVGYDTFPASIEQAMRNVAAAGLTDRVRFEVRDIMQGMPAEFDLVTAFDSVHDFPDPLNGLRAMAGGLNKDGTLLVLELDGPGNLIEEAGPLGIIHHATKLFYNLPVALAAAGEAKGNFAFSENVMKLLCRKAGVTVSRSLPVRNPLHKLFVIKKPPF